jgi:hypothetical protein
MHSGVLRRNYLNFLKMASLYAETRRSESLCDLIYTILCVKVGCSVTEIDARYGRFEEMSEMFAGLRGQHYEYIRRGRKCETECILL